MDKVLLLISGVLPPLLGVLLLARRRQQRFGHVGDAFRCRIRACGDPPAEWPRLGRQWPRRRVRARWLGDALIVRRGLFSWRDVRLVARVHSDGVQNVPSWDVTRCGDNPVSVELLVADGSRVEVAAPATERLALVGPYLAAVVKGFPRHRYHGGRTTT